MAVTQRRAIHAGLPPAGPYSPAIACGGLIFVSGLIAEDDEGRVTGDIAQQTKIVLDRLGDVLAAAGSDLAHAVTVHVYLRRAEDFGAMNAVYESYWTSEPPSRTTVVVDLIGADTLIEVTAVAAARGTGRDVFSPDGWARSLLPYSYAVRAAGTVYLAGLVARDPRTNAPVPGTAREQLDLIMANARDVLAAAGLTLDAVTSARVFLTEAAAFPEMNEAWRAHFPGRKPARATVVAGLMNPAYRVEVTLVAHAGAVEFLEADPPSGNLSGVVKAGATAFVSGMLAPGATVREQTRGTLQKAAAALARAGAAPPDVVEALVYLPDLSGFDEMNAAWQEVFPTAPPARATVGAGLLVDGGMVEIVLTAMTDR